MAALNAEVTRQAAMVAYIDNFKLLMFIALAALPLLLLLREARRRRPPAAAPATAAADPSTGPASSDAACGAGPARVCMVLSRRGLASEAAS